MIEIGLDAKRAFRNNTGLGNYSRLLIRGLSHWAEQNPGRIQIHMYGNNPKEEFKLELEALSHSRLALNSQSKFHTFSGLYRALGIQKDLKRDNIRLFHGLSAELPIGLKKLGISQVLNVHDLIFIRYPEYYNRFDRFTYLQKLKYAVKTADRILSTSVQTANDLQTYLGCSPEKIRVVYQDCLPLFSIPKSEEKESEIRRKHGLPQKFFLVVGTIEARKNGLRLVQAWDINKDIEEDLVFIGRKTAFFKEIEAYLRKSKKGHRVHFYENISFSELPYWIDTSTACVYVSEFEGFGIPILESFRRQKNVLTSTGSCFSEVGGEAALYCDPFTVESIAEGLKKLSEETKGNLRGELIRQQSAKFSLSEFAEKTISVYQELVSL